MTLLRLKSSFLCMLWVLFPLIGRTLAESIYDRSAADKKQKGRGTKSRTQLFLDVTISGNYYFLHVRLEVGGYPPDLDLLSDALKHEVDALGFCHVHPDHGQIGLSAQSGSHHRVQNGGSHPRHTKVRHTDVQTQSGLNLIEDDDGCVLLIFGSFLCPLTMVVRRTSSILTTLYLTVIVTCLAVLFTPLGFPFSADKTFPTPHRDLIIHTSREFYDQVSDHFF